MNFSGAGTDPSSCTVSLCLCVSVVNYSLPANMDGRGEPGQDG